MTREEIINHIADVVRAVLRAEDVVRSGWKSRLRATRGASEKVKQETADGYVRAIAEEILEGYSDEELQPLYGEE